VYDRPGAGDKLKAGNYPVADSCLAMPVRGGCKENAFFARMGSLSLGAKAGR